MRSETPILFIENVLKEGMEIGDIDDYFFKKKETKLKEGHFGLMTNNALNRTESYRDGVISALARFINEDFFK